MTKDYKERVQEYVREQIPDLRELSCGCEIEWENPPFRAIYRGIVTIVNPAGEFQVDSYSDKWLTENINLRKIIGHTPQLQDYLAVLGKVQGIKNIQISTKKMTVEYQPRKYLYFSLTDGQPKSEKDWEIMSEILEV